jgi:DNA-nicking Smr family endonuclease
MIKIDLHGLYVAEACDLVDSLTDHYFRSHNSRDDGCRCILLVIGRGLHSEDGAGRLGPALSALLRDKRCKFSMSEAMIKLPISV